MKKLNLNEVIKVNFDGKDTELISKNQFIGALSRPVNQGATYDEMASVIPLLKQLKTTTEDSILVETSEYNILVKYLKSMKWSVNDVALFEWITSVVNLPDVDVKEKD